MGAHAFVSQAGSSGDALTQARSLPAASFFATREDEQSRPKVLGAKCRSGEGSASAKYCKLSRGSLANFSHSLCLAGSVIRGRKPLLGALAVTLSSREILPIN